MLNLNLDTKTLDEAAEQLASPAPILITEQDVALGTAAALRARLTTRHRWLDATHVLLAGVHSRLVPSTQGGRQPHRDYPKHYAFLEHASLAREMDRL